ncbi:UBA/THIF-type NAD/FAD binding protein [Crinalium epipsammum PCC 9333]|uniref:UBA/THIF-type NAD/FAD binding protein n=1 Tax=Crinalium epipsammum PCC 9333 TaxID=1173022 RepID=K9VUE8_9CYAN|nr:ThiF family adenylyltransferase [Crinalium epipsammum]AFZ11556.1 UBA/THIF-type NAD/FAD binding protein [Crinalium epipsammum PCC 9333]
MRYPKISLHIPPQMWYQFRQVMQKARKTNEEVIGFFFCKRHQLSKHQVRYLPKSWVVPEPDCYERQSISGLVLKQQFHLYLLHNHLIPGLDVVHIHTHAGQGQLSFSCVDDRYESEYAKFLSSTFKKKPRLISGIFDESLQNSQFRLWDRKGQSFQKINFDKSWFALEEKTAYLPETELMFARQQVFGKTFQKQLGELSVTLIGCGGIGAIFAEQLGRLGVKKWLLIDPDRLETVNLNRMPAATPEMVKERWYKVHYVKQLIKRIYATGSSVKAMPVSITDESVQREVAATDLIVVATDNHYSRQVAQELALKYMRPLVCLGTHIDIQGNGTPRMYGRVTVPPLGGGWCLMCGNMINLRIAALELAPFEINHLAMQAGYLEGINNPAVFWLNSLCASSGVGVIHGMLSGFLNVDSGLDWIYDFSESNWLKTNTNYLTGSDCYFCG